jgi:hypothetical protein
MDQEKKSIYEDLAKRLNGFPVADFVREYARAYFDGDRETIRKLHELLLRRRFLSTIPRIPEPLMH